MNEAERDAFEKWMKSSDGWGLSLELDRYNTDFPLCYEDAKTHLAADAWLASVAHRTPAVRELVEAVEKMKLWMMDEAIGPDNAERNVLEAAARVRAEMEGK